MSKLFSPISIGAVTLAHRLVMAPLTRSRADLPNDVPNDLMVEYYSQRASEGGLVIGEASTISMSARGWLGAATMEWVRCATAKLRGYDQNSSQA